MSPGRAGSDLLWYASYGSNLSRARFDCYLRGGRPPGANRTYPGCRDTAEPVDVRAFVAAGSIHFAWESPTWGGGIAFFDPDLPGRTLCRAYLITAGQFADVAAQEMHRHPSGDLELVDLFAAGRLVLGLGRYESLHVVGEIDDHPVITFTRSDRTDLPNADPVPANAPSGAYLRMLIDGLAESHDLDGDEIVAYLGSRPGIGWSRADLGDLIAARLSSTSSPDPPASPLRS